MVYARMASERDVSLITNLTRCSQRRVAGMKKCEVAASKILRHNMHEVKLKVSTFQCRCSALVILLLVRPISFHYGSVNSDSNVSDVNESRNFNFAGQKKLAPKKKAEKKKKGLTD
jgi:hypothetical protein